MIKDPFELYHRIQDEISRNPKKTPLGLPALGHALAGSIGTAVSHLLLYPLDLTVTRCQVRNHDIISPSRSTPVKSPVSIFKIIREIYVREGGLGAFYAGCGLNTIKTLADAFLFFLVYTFLRTRRLRRLGKQSSIPALDEIGIGMMAGAASKFVTTPLSQIVIRKQTAASAIGSQGKTITDQDLPITNIISTIKRERGIRGFWAGYQASLILTLNPALTFLLQNLLLKLLVPSIRRKHPGPRLTFLIAAVSKAIASIVMYPINLAKSRTQSGQSSAHRVELEKDVSDSRPLPGSNVSAELIMGRMRNPNSIFMNLSSIYRKDGLAALYAGLPAEVMKGFLGHGLTMLLKEKIHVFVVGIYFLLLKFIKQGGMDSHNWKENASAEMSKLTMLMSRTIEKNIKDIVSVSKT